MSRECRAEPIKDRDARMFLHVMRVAFWLTVAVCYSYLVFALHHYMQKSRKASAIVSQCESEYLDSEHVRDGAERRIVQMISAGTWPEHESKSMERAEEIVALVAERGRNAKLWP